MLIKSSTAFLYKSMNLNSEHVDEVLHGTSVSILEQKGRWYYIRTEYGYQGWVEGDNLTAPAKALPQESALKIVNTLAADVLERPKVQSKLLLTLPLGSRIMVVTTETSVSPSPLREDEESPIPEGYTQIKLACGRRGFIRGAFLGGCPKNFQPVTLDGRKRKIQPVTECNRLNFEQTIRRKIRETAKKYLGTQYRWGGKTPLGIDCSGLTFMTYWLNGITIFRDAMLKPPLKKIPFKLAKEGDLLFFPGHVGILLDDGLMLHSSEKGNGVRIETLTEEWLAKLTDAGTVFTTE